VLASHLFCQGVTKPADQEKNDAQRQDGDAQVDAQAIPAIEAQTATAIGSSRQVAALTDGYINKGLQTSTRD